MRQIILTVILVVALITTYAQSPYYYYNGQQIELTIERGQLNIIMENNTIEAISSIAKNIEIAFNDSILTASIERISFVTTPNERQYNTIVNALRQNPNVNKVFPYFVRDNAEPIGTSDIFYVKLKNVNDLSVLQNIIQQNNVQIVKQVPFMPLWYILSIKNSVFHNSVEASNFFYETGVFDDIDPAFMFNFKLNCVNDPMFNQQWGLHNSSNPNIDVNVCDAWTITRGAGINVAIIDEGIDRSHNDLYANLHSLSFDAKSGTVPSQFINGDDHGTHVAGIVGAVRDNNLQVVGVAPEAKIIGISHEMLLSPSFSAEIASGFAWATEHGADIITNSWGDHGGYLYNQMHITILEDAIIDAINNGREHKGCVVIFAAGNYGVMDYPAYFDSRILTVGSINSAGQRSIFNSSQSSGVGAELDVVAPGSNILSTLPNNQTGYRSGTSMSAPHVAGVAALLLSINPCLTQQEVCNLIELSCEKVGSYCYQVSSSRPNGSWNSQTGYGIVNAYKALQYVYSPEIHSFNNISGNIYGNATSTYQWVVSQNSCVAAAGTYIAKRTEVRASVSYPYTASPMIVGSAKGFSSANPNDSKRYIGIVNISETNATVNTYVYEIYDVLGRYLGTYPNSATDVRFDFKVLSAFGTDTYLQNQTVGTTIAQSAIHNIYAGNNVTDAVSTGDYTIQNGANVNFHAGDAIFLKPGFHAQEGSTFHAGVEPYFTCEQFPSNVYSPYDNNDALSDYVIANYNVENFTSQTEKTPEKDVYFKVYPNPASDYINIEYSLNRSEMVEIILYNNSGHIIYRLKNRTMHEAGVYSIHLSGLALNSGIYHCVLQTENRKESAKIII